MEVCVIAEAYAQRMVKTLFFLSTIECIGKASKDKCLVSHQKKNEKGGGREGGRKVFLGGEVTEKMTIDLTYNGQTETIRIRLRYLNCQQIVCV